MSYTVLARRYRSRDFDEVVGQEAIARTLEKAIETGRVAHAYLFVGTRGVGKTSMARILAKALNAPGDEPADVAEAIMAGRDTDVIEIDAASNRGVDEARDLIAGSAYRPMRGGFKIYIIDEVHMLTREAFNALLKTMEEPPGHVKFILCTTEPHKVPATIQSRCQRFDFRNIATDRIADHLRSVIEREGMRAEPELVHAVARMGAGSMRDALSLLDRVMAASPPGEALTLELLEELLGLPPRDVVVDLLDAAIAGDAGTALEKTDELLSRGIASEQIVATVVDALRDVMALAACGRHTSIVELSDDARAQLAQLAERSSVPALVHMIALAESVAQRLKSAASPRALLDALVVRLAMTEQLADVAALLEGGSAPPVKSAGRGGSRAPPKKA